MNIVADLHTHTWYSDGVLSPSDLMNRARERGISHLAMTDHDSVAAVTTLDQAEIPEGLEIIAGTEISCLWQEREIHVLGLFIDPLHPPLQRLLATQQQARRQRVAALDRQLCHEGIEGLAAYIETLPCESPGRNHAADFLIRQGLAASRQQAFKKFLGKKGRFRVRAQWCDIPSAVAAIGDAGGVAVLAHPDRYRLNRGKLQRLIGDFAECGGQAMEVSYSNLQPDRLQKLADNSEAFGLWASAGSDFHDPSLTWMDIGRIRRLPENCAARAIWHHPRWRGIDRAR